MLAALLKPIADAAPPVPVPPAPPHWWWDSIWLAQAQVVFNILGTALALAAVLYAWRVAKKQFKLADEQGKIIDKQLALLSDHKTIFLELKESEKRQEALLAKQTEITTRQGEIAEAQFVITQRQEKLRPRLEMRGECIPKPNNERLVQLWLVNVGFAAARDVRWEVKHDISHSIADLNFVKSVKHTHEDGGVTYVVVSGELPGAVFVGPGKQVAYWLERSHEPRRTLSIEWRASCSEGDYPETGSGGLNVGEEPAAAGA